MTDASTSSSASAEPAIANTPTTASSFASESLEREPWQRYEPRMRKVIAHLYDHLDEPLDLMALSDVACMSPHHWHRIYHAMYGETLAQTVKRLRLHRAAGLLAHSVRPIARIAVDAGYPNLQSFTRIFKSVYGMPPARYRTGGQHSEFAVQRAASSTSASLEVSVRQMDAVPVLAVEHRGSYMQIGRAFDLLFGRIAAAGLARPGMRMFAMYFDDPTIVEEESLRARACVAGAAAAPVDCDLMSIEIDGGTYAVLTHTGPYASMKSAYQWLFGQWLVNSAVAVRSGPVVEEYLNSPRDTAPKDLRTRICLPVQAMDADGAVTAGVG